MGILTTTLIITIELFVEANLSVDHVIMEEPSPSEIEVLSFPFFFSVLFFFLIFFLQRTTSKNH